MKLADVIADSQALADATKAFRDTQPDWDGTVAEVKLIERSYYGHVHCLSIKAAGVAYLVSPHLCHPPYNRHRTLSASAIAHAYGAPDPASMSDTTITT